MTTISEKNNTASSFSKQDEKLYQSWFHYVDSDGDGRVTGNDAVGFFSLSNLSRPQLKQVWALADSNRRGFLGFKEFILSMQIISLYQTGNEVTAVTLKEIDLQNVSPPVMEGLDEMLAASNGRKQTLNGHGETNGHSVDSSPKRQKQTPFVSWFTSKNPKMPMVAVTSVVDGLKRCYEEKLKPLETAYKFDDLVSPPLTASDFDAKPMVMLLGQYSTGKTTFIRHLLGSSYPGSHVGPEPTTDRFVVVMSGSDERSIPGNTIAVQADKPFGALTRFGSAFLSKFECSQMPHPLLDHITFVDTPGVLAGEKQRTQRSYDFTGVTSWFAGKCDRILLFFDPYKLDISDELKRVIESLRGHDDKIRVVLNKADQVDTQHLMRVYGALMWSLGKVLNTPEVTRVYIGSFNDKQINVTDSAAMTRALFEKEQEDLLADLKDIPRMACERRVNEFVKRARAAKIHAYIMSHLKKEMPTVMGKTRAQQRLMENLEEEFSKVQNEHHLPLGDFPNAEKFREVLQRHQIDKFEKLKPKMIQAVDDMLGHDIPDLLEKFRNPYD